MTQASSAIVVYSTASYPPHPDFIIYNVIAGAIAYARSLRRDARPAIEIRLLPLGIREYLRHVLGDAAALLHRRRPRTFAATAAAGHLSTMEFASFSLTITRYSSGVGVLRNALRSFVAARSLWESCFVQGAFSPLAFLEVSYRGVRIGDLAASDSLRSGDRTLAALDGGMWLFRMLLDSVLIVNLCLDDVDPPRDSAVLVLEPTYRHAVHKRALRARGLTVIEAKVPGSRSFAFVSAHEELRSPYLAPPPAGPLTEHDRRRAEEYLADRLADPRRHLPYLTEGFNRNDPSTVRTLRGEPIVAEPAKVHVALFLHSFDDAQYLYGVDGFADLCAWADFTLSACLANPGIGSVIVKSHPNINESLHAKTLRTEAWLRRKFAAERRVAWIERDTSLAAIAGLGKVVGITHHGSVAEELVFLGVPVIAYGNAAWRDGYRFVRAWRDPAAYGELLKAISPDGHRGVSPEERESLLLFVREYRLRPESGDIDNLYPYKRWLASKGRAARDRPDEEYQEDLAALSAEESAEFLDFLATASDS